MMVFIGANYEELGLSPEQLQDKMGKWFSWGDKMQAQGILRGGAALTAEVKRVSARTNKSLMSFCRKQGTHWRLLYGGGRQFRGGGKNC